VRVVRLLLFPELLGILAAPLSAQQHWGIAVELGKASFNGHGSATATSPETTGHPSPTTIWGLRVSRTGPKVEFSLGVLFANTGVLFESEDAAVESRGLLELLEVSPQVSFVLLRPREVALRIHLGAVLDHWSPEGANTRTLFGGLGALSLDLPFSSRFGAGLRWETVLTGSVFEENELPPEFSLKSGWSERWVLGVRYTL
jgi:hypothetical protein